MVFIGYLDFCGFVNVRSYNQLQDTLAGRMFEYFPFYRHLGVFRGLLFLFAWYGTAEIYSSSLFDDHILIRYKQFL